MNMNIIFLGTSGSFFLTFVDQNISKLNILSLHSPENAQLPTSRLTLAMMLRASSLIHRCRQPFAWSKSATSSSCEMCWAKTTWHR